MNLGLATSDEVKELLCKQLNSFLERNSSILAGESASFIIEKWLEWQFRRYVVDEQEDSFYVNDLKEKRIVACVTKNDPHAYQHAYSICDDLNNLKCDGTITVNDDLYFIADNRAIDAIIKNIELDAANEEHYDINDVVKDVFNRDDDE